jgi:hypothetical protein
MPSRERNAVGIGFSRKGRIVGGFRRGQADDRAGTYVQSRI